MPTYSMYWILRDISTASPWDCVVTRGTLLGTGYKSSSLDIKMAIGRKTYFNNES